MAVADETAVRSGAQRHEARCRLERTYGIKQVEFEIEISGSSAVIRGRDVVVLLHL